MQVLIKQGFKGKKLQTQSVYLTRGGLTSAGPPFCGKKLVNHIWKH